MSGKLKTQRINTMPGNSTVRLPGELVLVTIDTVLFKDLFHRRLAVKIGDPGCIYLHSETDYDYAKQIVSEEKVRDRKGIARWKQVRSANHLLDAEIYASVLIDPALFGGLVMKSPSTIQQTQKSTGAVPYRQQRRKPQKGYRSPKYKKPDWLRAYRP
jgi:phage terminase large subunit GpA-like protein